MLGRVDFGILKIPLLFLHSSEFLEAHSSVGAEFKESWPSKCLYSHQWSQLTILPGLSIIGVKDFTLLWKMIPKRFHTATANVIKLFPSGFVLKPVNMMRGI